MGAGEPTARFAVVVGMKRWRFAPFFLNRALVIRGETLSFLRPNGSVVMAMPLARTTVRLSPARIVRLEGPGGRTWLTTHGDANGVLPKLRRLLEAEGGIVGPLAPSRVGVLGAATTLISGVDAVGLPGQLVRGNRLLAGVLWHLGALGGPETPGGPNRSGLTD